MRHLLKWQNSQFLWFHDFFERKFYAEKYFFSKIQNFYVRSDGIPTEAANPPRTLQLQIVAQGKDNFEPSIRFLMRHKEQR
jgi:hypothetical protein